MMKLISNCLECFGEQISRLMIPEEDKRQLFLELFNFASKYKNLFKDTPVHLARLVYKNKVVIDFFRKAKPKEIEFSLKVAKDLSDKDLPLIEILKISTALNVYDFSAPQFENQWKEKIKEIEVKCDVENINGKVLYILDNCSEIGVDILFLENLKKKKNVEITVMPRQQDFINDVTIDDLVKYDLNKKIENFAEIIPLDIYESSKSKNVIKLSELPKFVEKFDFVVSKGQANYEILSEFKFEKPKIIYALIAKCKVIADEIGIAHGKGIIFQI
ncbi:MAG: ARMT1-like domain-containing protein [Candidatus Woesearchaeota archaeon]